MISSLHMQAKGAVIQEKGNSQSVESKPNVSYLQYVHYFRAVAILGIVAVHCKSSFAWSSRLEEQLWSSLLVYSTVLFVFIAGFLFQHIHSKKFDYKNYLSKKFTYVILPYLFASIPAIIEKLLDPERMFWLPDYLQGQSAIFQVIYMLVTGKHFGPFWFIPMITLIYLISPALVLLDKQPWFYRFAFPVLFFAGLFMFNFGFESTTLESFAFFIPIYIFGMWTSRNKEQITGMGYKLLVPLSLMFIALVVLEVAGVLSLDTSYGAYRPEETYNFPFNFGKLKMSVLCLIMLNSFYLIRYKNFPVLTLLADYSFGIYFIHLYVIRIFEQVVKMLHVPFQFNSFYFLVHVGLITVISYLMIFFIKKLAGKYSRYFIGS